MGTFYFFQPDSFCQVGILECCHGAMREPKKIKNIFLKGVVRLTVFILHFHYNEEDG